MRKLRVAVIGIGKMGLLHAGLLGSMVDVELVALCDQKKLLITLAKKIFRKNIQVVNDIHALSDLDLDAVYLTTPIPSHYALLNLIYSEKIASHVFCEKTLSLDIVDSENICKRAQQPNGVNMIGFQKRYGVTFNKAFNLLHDHAIGEIQRFKACSYSSDFVGLPAGEAAKIFSSRGGVLRDLGSHAISLALWYFGPLQVINDSSLIDNGETVAFLVKNDNVNGHIEASWCKEGYRLPETGLEIEGSKGSLKVNDDKVEVKLRGAEKITWFRQDLSDNVDFVLWAPEYYREDSHFVHCALHGYSANPNFYDGLLVDKIISEVTQKKC